MLSEICDLVNAQDILPISIKLFPVIHTYMIRGCPLFHGGVEEKFL